jgi:transcription initiation factor TFIIIB Brf1 subunit/transcription initiation factor TFIIB
MEDFALFEEAIQEIDKQELRVKIHTKNPWPEDSCQHENITNEKNITICVDCGEELQGGALFDKEWRFYGNNDNRFSSDPNRCQIRKNGERSIYKDVEGLNLNDNIVSTANELYKQVTGGQIHRGNRRRGIIFACIRQAYIYYGKPQPFDTLVVLFNIQRKAGLNGIKYINPHIPEDFKKQQSFITHEDLIRKIMNMFQAKPDQIKEVLELYPKIRDKSKMLNGSRASSLAAGLIYYWIDKNKKTITIKEFSSKVELSELTVKKIFNEITRVFNAFETKN